MSGECDDCGEHATDCKCDEIKARAYSIVEEMEKRRFKNKWYSEALLQTPKPPEVKDA